MIVDINDLKPSHRYHLMTQTIVPRPIAWVLTTNDDSGHNLAPFSYFNAISSEPALVVLSMGKKPDGQLKDTRHNLLSGRDCVIHIASVVHAEAVTASSAVLAYGDSELERAGVELVPFGDLMRVAGCAVAYRARLYEAHDIGPAQQGVLYCELLEVFIDEHIVDAQAERLVIDAEKLDPLARLGGAAYVGIRSPFDVARPVV